MSQNGKHSPPQTEEVRQALAVLKAAGYLVLTPAVVRQVRGHGGAAILLAHFLSHGEGWFSQSREQIEARTGLGAGAQQTARDRLKKLHLLEERREGLPARSFYRVVAAAASTAQPETNDQLTGLAPQLDAGLGMSNWVQGSAQQLETNVLPDQLASLTPSLDVRLDTPDSVSETALQFDRGLKPLAVLPQTKQGDAGVEQKPRLYHDPKWLRRELKRFGSLATLCKAHQLSEGTVISYLRRHPEVKSQVEDLLKKPESLLKRAGKRREVGQTRLATLKRHKRDWTVDELRAQNLPLYWDHNWLVQQLTELRTLTAVCQKYGYNVNAVQRYISRQPDLLNSIHQVREEMRAGQVPILINLPPAIVAELEAAPTQRDVLVAAIRRGIEHARSKRGDTG